MPEGDLPRVWEDPAAWFAAAAPEGRRPDELTSGCIEYIEGTRAHAPRLRRIPGIVQVVDSIETWSLTRLNDLDERGLTALQDVVNRLSPFAARRLDDLATRVRGRLELVRLRRNEQPSEALLNLCETAVSATSEEDHEFLLDRFRPVDDELAAGLLMLETRYPDLAEVAVPPFEKEVQTYAVKRAAKVLKARRAIFAGSIVSTVALFVVRCT